MPESTAGPDGTPRDPWAFCRWAFDQTTGNAARKAVLSALASMADAETGRCEARHSTLAQWVEISRRSVIRHIEALRQAGLVATRRQYRRDGSRRGDEFLLLAPWISEWPDGDPIQSANGDQSATVSHGQSANGDQSKVPNGTSEVSRLSHQERPLKNDHLGTEISPLSARASLPELLRLDVDELLRAKRKVDSRLVTEGEMLTAAAALAEFNRQAEADFGLGANLTCLVMRIRERPSWDAAKHSRLVESAWRIRWWERRGGKRRPTPQVIYGNANVFEQVAQDAADEAAGRPVETEVHGERLFFGGRRWHELSTGEQNTARDLMARGIDPASYVPDVAERVNGNGEYVTAETFLN